MGPSLVRAILMPKFQGKTLPKTTFCGKIIKYCRRSVKDITQDSGSCNGGSIPSGDVWIQLYVIIRNQKARFYGLFVYT